MTRDEERAIEWECQKVLSQYYHHVDQREYDEAVKLFTPDVHWQFMGLDLHSREEVRGQFGGLAEATIHHVLTNFVVTVIDENNADLKELLSKVGDGGFQAARSISFSPSLNLTPSTISARR